MAIYPHPNGSTRMYSGATPHRALARKASHARATNVRGCSSCLRPSVVQASCAVRAATDIQYQCTPLSILSSARGSSQVLGMPGTWPNHFDGPVSPRIMSPCVMTMASVLSLISTDRHNISYQAHGECRRRIISTPVVHVKRLPS